MPVSNHMDSYPHVTEVSVDKSYQNFNGTRILVKLRFDDDVHVDAGAPETATLSYLIAQSQDGELNYLYVRETDE
jgi:hypothetical protein